MSSPLRSLIERFSRDRVLARRLPERGGRGASWRRTRISRAAYCSTAPQTSVKSDSIRIRRLSRTLAKISVPSPDPAVFQSR